MKTMIMLFCSAFISVTVFANQTEAQIVSIEKAIIETIQPKLWLPGNVVNRLNAPISAEQTGQLLSIIEVGRQVQQGDVIAEIDNRSLQLLLSEQKAQIAQYQANTEFLTKQKQRLSTLKAKNNTAVSDYERTIKDLLVAKSEVIAQQMQIKQTELAIEKTIIKAPFSGYISERYAHVGELITVGRPMVQLVDPNHLDILIAAPISIAPFLEQNLVVSVKWQDTQFELPIRTWSRAGDQTTRTFNVRLQANDIGLLSGTAVQVALPKLARINALLVPRDALHIRMEDTFVLKVDEQLKVEKIAVEVGEGQGNWVSVKGDIAEEDTVIVRGGERLQPGQLVRIEKKPVELAKK